MTTHTSAQARSIWKDTRVLISTTTARAPRPAHTEQPRPATKTQVPAEKEADAWVAEMMFDHYNG
jgi:hypothetical protein